MSEPLGDSEFHSVPLSDTSNDSIQRSPTQEQTPFIRPTETTRPATTARPFPTTSRSSTSDEPFLFIPEEDQFLIPRPGTTDEPISTNQPASSAEPASSIGPSDSSPPKIPTYIHPVSEGGSVTWKDHSELVYHKGKDRGPRTPAPTLQPGYKSKGPLRDTFDFDKLRTSRGKSAPVRKFQDEYDGKQDQTPTQLVTEIVAHFVSNEDEHTKYLLQKGTERQALNDTIRVQEQEINALKKQREEATAGVEFSPGAGGIIIELNKAIKNGERQINNFRRRVDELEIETFTGQDAETEELVQRLMGRVAELEGAARIRGEESSTTSRNPYSGKQEKLINDLLDTIAELGEAVRNQNEESSASSQYPDSAKQEKGINDFVEDVKDKAEHFKNLWTKIEQLAETIRRLRGPGATPSKDPDRAERERKVQDLDLGIKARDRRIKDLLNMPHKSQEAECIWNKSETETSHVPERSRLESRLTELSQLLKEREATINDLLKRNLNLKEEADRLRRETSPTPSQDQERGAGESNAEDLKDREDLVNPLLKRNRELEAADRGRQETRTAISPRVQSIKQMIETAKWIKASLLECQVRVLLLKAKSHLDGKEHVAAGKEAVRAQDIMRADLPHLGVLHGKVMYVHGRVMYETGFIPEAIRDLNTAVKMGFDRNCTEVDGDCAMPLLVKARVEHQEAEGFGYPAGADLRPDL